MMRLKLKNNRKFKSYNFVFIAKILVISVFLASCVKDVDFEQEKEITVEPSFAVPLFYVKYGNEEIKALLTEGGLASNIDLNVPETALPPSIEGLQYPINQQPQDMLPNDISLPGVPQTPDNLTSLDESKNNSSVDDLLQAASLLDNTKKMELLSRIKKGEIKLPIDIIKEIDITSPGDKVGKYVESIKLFFQTKNSFPYKIDIDISLYDQAGVRIKPFIKLEVPGRKEPGEPLERITSVIIDKDQVNDFKRLRKVELKIKGTLTGSDAAEDNDNDFIEIRSYAKVDLKIEKK